MKTTAEYLDAIKEKLDLPSDYAISKVLGITRESVSGFRTGKSPFGVETAMKVGEILGIDGHKVYSDGQIERAKKPEIRQFWMSISEKFSMGFEVLISCANPRRSLFPA